MVLETCFVIYDEKQGDKRMKKVALIFAVLLFSGCAAQTYHINKGAASSPTKDKMQHFFVSGLGQEVELNAADVCGGAENIIKVQSRLEFIDGFLGFVTFGIYTPRHAKVYCKSS